ncbi:hypothetical protein BN1317_110014 [Staphylococcus capitis]|nr:hypothetical protein CR01_30101 [Staphylococcus capitis CR01]CQD29367.1 hypothetical protein SCAPIOD60014 [Staphylococcus capitis]CQD31384.1 hypothetical protein SCAPIOD20061 [Staphylococcus capitis]CRN12195.1 hypothetical protein BN151760103 [Staphylococcus capitis]CUT94333.1 hypothetical protein BN1317_110014 [Staphylococcus capitis]
MVSKKYAMQFLIKIRDLLHTSYQNYFFINTFNKEYTWSL